MKEIPKYLQKLVGKGIAITDEELLLKTLTEGENRGRKKIPLSDELISEIEESLSKGISINKISIEKKISSITLKRRLIQLGISPLCNQKLTRLRPWKISLEEAQTLRKAGKTAKEIAKDHGISLPRVYQILRTPTTGVSEEWKDIHSITLK
jgi:hypothetical protein